LARWFLFPAGQTLFRSVDPEEAAQADDAHILKKLCAFAPLREISSIS
jgi:hypothetical protein